MFKTDKHLDLYDQDTFYEAFKIDLLKARRSVIIESPFMTMRRLSQLLPLLKMLEQAGVTITVNTKDPAEYEQQMACGATKAIHTLQQLGVIVLYTVGHHRKLAIIDNHILWHGSLNILSQYDSCEIMERNTSRKKCKAIIEFIGIS